MNNLFLVKIKRQIIFIINNYTMGCGQISTVQPITKDNQNIDAQEEPILLNNTTMVEVVESKTQIQQIQVKAGNSLPNETNIDKHQFTNKQKQNENRSLLLPRPDMFKISTKLNAATKHIFESAQKLFAQKQYEQARKKYESLNIKDQYLLNQIGATYYEQCNYDKAMNYFNSSLKINDKHIVTHFKIGLAYYYQQEYEKAITSYDKCLNIQNNAEVLSEIGQCYYYLQNYDKAKEYFNRSLALDQNNLKTLQRLALAYYYNDQHIESIQPYKKILSIQPNNTKIINQIGNSYYQNQNYDQSIKWYQQAIDNEPTTSKYYFNMGSVYYWKEQYQKARQWYQKAIKLDPSNDQIFSQIGYTFYYEQNYETAIGWFQKAIALNPHSPLTYHRMGLVYYYIQDYKTSRSWYKKALEQDNKYVNSIIGMANCFYYEQNYSQAMVNFKRSLQLDSTKGNTYYMIGKTLYYDEKSEQSLSYYQKAIDLCPKQVIYYIFYGKALIDIQNYGQGYKIFVMAKEIFDRDPDEDDGDSFIANQINLFISNSAQWEQKKRIGYISAKDKEEIKNMKKNFQKKFKSVFGVDTTEKKKNSKKPLNSDLIQIAKLILQDQFTLSISNPAQSKIAKIAQIVRKIYNYDLDSFQIFAYLFQEYVWIQVYQQNLHYSEVQKNLTSIVQILSQKYPPTSKTNRSLDHQIIFPDIKSEKYDLFTEAQFFGSYDSMVKEIQRVNKKAEVDLDPFRQFVYIIEKNHNGDHAKVGMKLPTFPKETCEQAKQIYQHKLFKVLIRIFQKMFKQLSNKKQEMFEQIEQKLKKSDKISIHSVMFISMNIWIENINKILIDRQSQNIPTPCYISDLVRGKCMFQSVQAVQQAALGVIKLCAQKGYQVMQLDNRLLKQTQDVVFKIKVKNVVSQFQLALEFDTIAFDFGHSFYEIERCPLGRIFGSCLFLTKDVSQSFLQQIFNTKCALNSIPNPDKQAIKATEYILQTFKQSSKK